VVAGDGSRQARTLVGVLGAMVRGALQDAQLRVVHDLLLRGDLASESLSTATDAATSLSYALIDNPTAQDAAQGNNVASLLSRLLEPGTSDELGVRAASAACTALIHRNRSCQDEADTAGLVGRLLVLVSGRAGKLPEITLVGAITALGVMCVAHPVNQAAVRAAGGVQTLVNLVGFSRYDAVRHRACWTLGCLAAHNEPLRAYIVITGGARAAIALLPTHVDHDADLPAQRQVVLVLASIRAYTLGHLEGQLDALAAGIFTRLINLIENSPALVAAGACETLAVVLQGRAASQASRRIESVKLLADVLKRTYDDDFGGSGALGHRPLASQGESGRAGGRETLHGADDGRVSPPSARARAQQRSALSPSDRLDSTNVRRRQRDGSAGAAPVGLGGTLCGAICRAMADLTTGDSECATAAVTDCGALDLLRKLAMLDHEEHADVVGAAFAAMSALSPIGSETVQEVMFQGMPFSGVDLMLRFVEDFVATTPEPSAFRALGAAFGGLAGAAAGDFEKSREDKVSTRMGERIGFGVRPVLHLLNAIVAQAPHEWSSMSRPETRWHGAGWRRQQGLVRQPPGMQEALVGMGAMLCCLTELDDEATRLQQQGNYARLSKGELAPLIGILALEGEAAYTALACLILMIDNDEKVTTAASVVEALGETNPRSGATGFADLARLLSAMDDPAGAEEAPELADHSCQLMQAGMGLIIRLLERTAAHTKDVAAAQLKVESCKGRERERLLEARGTPFVHLLTGLVSRFLPFEHRAQHHSAEVDLRGALCEAGVLSGAVAALRKPGALLGSAVSLTTLDALTGMFRDHAASQEAAHDAGLIAPLVQLVREGVRPTKIRALSTLAAFVARNGQIRAAVGAVNVIPDIVRLILPRTNDQTREGGAAKRRNAVATGIFDAEILQSALVALAHLAAANITNQFAIMRSGGVVALAAIVGKVVVSHRGWVVASGRDREARGGSWRCCPVDNRCAKHRERPTLFGESVRTLAERILFELSAGNQRTSDAVRQAKDAVQNGEISYERPDLWDDWQSGALARRRREVSIEVQ
jgi:hypothetical protein